MTPQMPATCARVLAVLETSDAPKTPMHTDTMADWMAHYDVLAKRAGVNRPMVIRAMCWLASRPAVAGDAWEIVPDEAVGFTATPDYVVTAEDLPS